MSNTTSKAYIERLMMSSHFFVNHSFIFMQKKAICLYFGGVLSTSQPLEENNLIAA